MALQINVHIQAALPDGTVVVNVVRADLTFNPVPDDCNIEAELAKATADTLASDAVSQLGDRLDNWAQVVMRNIAEARAEQRRREE